MSTALRTHATKPHRRAGVAGRSGVRATGRVALLDAHSDLVMGLDRDAVPDARRALVVPAVVVAPGVLDPSISFERHGRGNRIFALMIIDGLLVREKVLGDRPSTEILGPGDVLRPAASPEAALPIRTTLQVATRCSIALLDDGALAAARKWPRLVSNLFELTLAQVDRAGELHALAQLPRVEDRLLGVLWHLAERFGRMRPDGAVVSMNLTHQALGQLIGARRPTVSLGLQSLEQQAVVTRQNGNWLLSPDSQSLVGRLGGRGN